LSYYLLEILLIILKIKTLIFWRLRSASKIEKFWFFRKEAYSGKKFNIFYTVGGIYWRHSINFTKMLIKNRRDNLYKAGLHRDIRPRDNSLKLSRIHSKVIESNIFRELYGMSSLI